MPDPDFIQSVWIESRKVRYHQLCIQKCSDYLSINPTRVGYFIGALHSKISKSFLKYGLNNLFKQPVGVGAVLTLLVTDWADHEAEFRFGWFGSFRHWNAPKDVSGGYAFASRHST
ncbi:hypothetical protein CK214_19005 [Mesorhizobium sp. WSM3882]|nr:hypothetical protein CK214_19005 [Mesorhizobium sp. WSM3882]